MKKRLTAILTLLLTISILLSLSACGEEKNPADTKENVENTSHPEFVYTSEFYPIETETKYGLTPIAYANGGIYCSGVEKAGTREHEGEAARNGQFDIENTVLYFLGMDGSFKKLSDYSCIRSEENADKPDFAESSSIPRIFPDKDGNLRFIENYSYNYYDGDESVNPETDPETYYSNIKFGTDYYYRCCDTNGKILSSVKIQVPEGEYVETYGAWIDEDGSCYLPGEQKIIKLSPDGTLSDAVSIEVYPTNIIKLKDGRFAAQCYGETRYLQIFDPAAGSIGEKIQLPNSGADPVIGGGDYDFYYNNGSYFCGFNLQTQEETKLFSWLDVDINGDCAYEFMVDDEGRAAGIIRNFDKATETDISELVVVSRKPYEEVPHKIEITVSGYAVDYDIRKIIATYNRNNDKYRIKFQDYAEYNSDGFYCGSPIDSPEKAEGRMKLLTEIMAGDMPDILMLSYQPFEQLAAKGLLEDLYPYLDADKELGRESIVPAALDALATGDRLYRISTGFDIQTAKVMKAALGDRESLSYADALEILDQMPEGCAMYGPFASREDILDISVAQDIEQYVNWETGECNFDRPEFVDFLNYLNRIPTRESIDKALMSAEPPGSEDPFMVGKQLFQNLYIYSPEDYIRSRSAADQESVFVGYPGLNGSGNVMRLNCCCAMSSRSENKEGAWDFMRILLREQTQTNAWNCPTNMNALNESIKKVMMPRYALDENGNTLLDENGEKVKVPRSSHNTPNGRVDIYELSQEEADDYMKLISETKTCYDDHSAIVRIIWEEAQPFFAGQKSAEDVAKLIQSKANIYVNEQR